MRTLVCALLLTATGVSAFAEGRSEPRRSAWYGWQTLAADAAGAGLIALGAETHDGLEAVGVPLLLGSPLIHLAHHRTDRFVGSLTLRLALPLAGSVIGASIVGDDCRPGDIVCVSPGHGAGFVSGLVLASLVDATLLGWERGEPSRGGRAVAPVFVPLPGGGGLGLGGGF